MGRAERLKLLFGNEDSLLQINTHLKVPTVSTVEIPEPQKGDPTAKKGDVPSQQLPVQKVEQPKTHEDKDTDQKPKPVQPKHPIIEITPDLQDTAIWESGSFCPLVAVSRFPYKFIRGELTQPVANEFFAEGKFWKRRWDLYYIYVPPHLGARPLLLVPTSQVEQLLKEINRAFEATCTLPTIEGFVVSFQGGDGTPQPSFLGQSTSREMKDYLESRMCTLPYKGQDLNDAIPEHQAFSQKVEAVLKLTKHKKASKAKKQVARIQSEYEWRLCFKRTQAYFGLRSDTSINQAEEKPEPPPLIENQRTETEAATGFKPVDHLTVNPQEPAPYPFLKEPVFISVDVECNERCHSQVTEVGISMLDTLDLAGLVPGEGAINWRSQIRSRHLRVREFGHIVNHDFVAGCPDRFEFGDSEWTSLQEVTSVIEECFHHPSARQTQTQTSGNDQKRNLVLVGHNPAADIKYLKDLGVSMFNRPSSTETVFLDTVDTAEVFRVSRGELSARSLGNILSSFGITGWYLHNAGNDARYTMEAMVALVLNPESEQVSEN